MPIIGALLSLVEAYARWPFMHYVSFAWSTLSWFLLAIAWWRVQTCRVPLAVVYGCPFRCGYQGDEAGVVGHLEDCFVAARRA